MKNTFSLLTKIIGILCAVLMLATIAVQFIPCWEETVIVKTVMEVPVENPETQPPATEPPVAEEPEPLPEKNLGEVWVEDPSSWLNLREGPGVSYACVCTNPDDPYSIVRQGLGTQVEILEEVQTNRGVWLKVRVLYEGQWYEGYSARYYIHDVTAPATPSEPATEPATEPVTEPATEPAPTTQTVTVTTEELKPLSIAEYVWFPYNHTSFTREYRELTGDDMLSAGDLSGSNALIIALGILGIFLCLKESKKAWVYLLPIVCGYCALSQCLVALSYGAQYLIGTALYMPLFILGIVLAVAGVAGIVASCLAKRK